MRHISLVIVFYVASAVAFIPANFGDRSIRCSKRPNRVFIVHKALKENEEAGKNVGSMIPTTEGSELSSRKMLSWFATIFTAFTFAIALIDIPLTHQSSASAYAQVTNVQRENTEDKMKFSLEPFTNKEVLSKILSSDPDSPSPDRALEHKRLVEGLAREPDWFNYVAAFSASVITTLIIHPLDTVKVRIMAKRNASENVSIVDFLDEDSKALSPLPDPKSRLAPYMTKRNRSLTAPFVARSPPKSASRLPKETSALSSSVTSISYENTINPDSIVENFQSLYTGILPNIMKEGPPLAVYLGLYESSVSMLKTDPFFSEHFILTYLVAGAIGEFPGTFLRVPIEAIKTRVQTGFSIGDALNVVFLSEEGRRNTFKAWSSSCFRDIPYGAIQMANFEALKLFIISTPYLNIDVDSLLSESILGAICGGISAFLTTPSDLVTTSIISSKQENLSAFDCINRILDENGPRGLFVGSAQRTVYGFFAVGIFLSSYGALRHAAVPLFA